MIEYITVQLMQKFVCTVQNQWTPLHLAAQNGHVEVVETLIKSGADISVVEKVSQCENND